MEIFRENLPIVETYVNTINHVLISSTAIYMSYLSYTVRAIEVRMWHMFLCTIGVSIVSTNEHQMNIFTNTAITTLLQYQLLMTEAILSLYHLNSWSRLHCRRTRNNIHWILQVIGSALAIAGMVVEFQLNVNHLLSIHAWTGN